MAHAIAHTVLKLHIALVWLFHWLFLMFLYKSYSETMAFEYQRFGLVSNHSLMETATSDHWFEMFGGGAVYNNPASNRPHKW